MRSFDRALDDGRSIRVRTTERLDGDFSTSALFEHGRDAELDARRRVVVDRPWVWLHQVHGADCLDVDALGVDEASGRSADAAVTTSTACALAVQTADCVPLALWSEDGVIAVVHVGWRGFEAGVIDAATAVLRGHSAEPLHAVIGPSIGPECYEFGVADLDRLRAKFGESIRSRTPHGRPALHMRAGVRRELEALGVHIDLDDEVCTACDDRLFSHRARSESGRHSMVIWLEEK